MAPPRVAGRQSWSVLRSSVVWWQPPARAPLAAAVVVVVVARVSRPAPGRVPSLARVLAWVRVSSPAVS